METSPMRKITKEEADLIIHENLHQKTRKHIVAKYKGQWFDIRGLSKLELISNVKKVFGYLVNPDCII